jgi:predicted permease
MAMGNYLQDLRFALRQVRKRPAFSAAAVLVLGLGLGANTAIFSVVNALLLRPLPYPGADRIAALYERNIAGERESYNSVAAGTYADWQKLSTTFEAMAGYLTGPITVGGAGTRQGAERVDGAMVSPQWFGVLGVAPLEGRAFTAAEDRFGADQVAVIGYGMWQQRFGGARDIVGRRIRLNGKECTVIGVMPPGFAFPERNTQAWLPLRSLLPPPLFERHDLHFLDVVGRIKHGMTMEAARAEIDGISARYKRVHPEDAVAPGANLLPLHAALVRRSRPTLLLLWAAVGCVLLIAAVNVANLLLVRASGRAREIAIRAATGANRSRLVQLLMTESLLLSVAGAGLGLMLALPIANMAATRIAGERSTVTAGEIPLDWHVFLFALAAALLVGVACGLFPALQYSRGDLAQALREGGRSGTHGRAQARFRAVLAATEVAVSLVLLIAAGLLLRSFSRLMQVLPGVRVDHTITMMIPFIQRPQARVAAFFRDLPQRLAAVPGVAGAGLTTCLPASGHCSDYFFMIDGRPVAPGHVMDALQRNADPGYFSAIGLPLLRGRTFTAEDGIGPDRKQPRRPVVVISEALAKSYFPTEDPIGQHVRLGAELQDEVSHGIPAPHYQIIGVVGDTPEGIDRGIKPTIYMPITDQSNYAQIYVVLHTTGDPRGSVAAARAEINRLDPDMAIDQVRTIRELVARSASGHQANLLLFGCFAGLALFLAAFGLYSVLSYTVLQRRAEIGVRMALGATTGSVAGYILREGMKPVAAGMLVGLPAAAASCGLLQTLLFGIEPLDPVAFAAAPLALLIIAALACYLPVLRAVQIDPATTLRSE